MQQMEVPLLYYKGYHAVTDKGEPVQITPGTSYRISLSVPPGFAGSIRVEFGGTPVLERSGTGIGCCPAWHSSV